MKNLLLTFSFLLFCFLSMGQINEEKQYFDTHKDLGGDVSIKKSYVKIDGELAYRVFEIEVPEEGEYYMNSWMMVPLTKEGYKNFSIKVNDKIQTKSINPKKDGWQNIKPKDKSNSLETIKLKKGLNTIAIGTSLPDIPEIEFVKLSKDINKAEISSEKYDAFVTRIREDMLTKSYNVAKKDSTTSKLKSYTLDTKGGNYYNVMDVNYNYTYNTSFYFTAGTKVTFSAGFSSPSPTYDPVIELFNESNPEGSESWVAYNGSYNVSLTATIGSTGTYRLRLRPYWQNTSGMVALYKDGVLYANHCPVAGAIIGHEHQTPTTYNYFTTNITQDTKLWLEDASGVVGKIRGYNDDYYTGGGDFNWGYASRIKKDFSVVIRGIHVTAYSSNAPTGTCDVYIKCMNSNVTSLFPILKADDAIQSAPEDTRYNCIGWSGGEYPQEENNYDAWRWPPTDWGQGWWSSDDLTSFDNYYNYERYAGCDRFTQTGATKDNAIVAVWYNPNFCTYDLDAYGNWYYKCGNYTHASVKKPANNHPHGYNWESKPGQQMRTFHPQNALEDYSDGGYGVINNYYQQSSLKSKSKTISLTLEESISQDLSEVEIVTFTQEELGKLTEMKKRIQDSDYNEFELKYSLWKSTWQNPELTKHSNPRMYAMSNEYKEFIEFCKLKGQDIWSLVINKFIEGDYMVRNAIEDLTFTGYFSLMDSVRTENINQTQSKNGKVLVHTSNGYWNKYIKKLLHHTTGDFRLKSLSSDEQIPSQELNKSLEIYPNPASNNLQIRIEVKEKSVVNLALYNVTGQQIVQIVPNKQMDKGWHTINCNIGNYQNGSYILQYRVNGKLYTEKIQIAK